MAYDDSRPVPVDTDTDTHANHGLAPTGAAAAALARLDRATRTFLALDGLDTGSPRALLHATAASMHDFITTIDACEAAGLDRDGLRRSRRILDGPLNSRGDMRTQVLGNFLTVLQAETLIEARAKAAVADSIGAEVTAVQSQAAFAQAQDIQEQRLEAVIAGH